MFVYDSVHFSTVLLIAFTHEDYHVSYHHTEQDGREMITFVQTRRATNDEMERFEQWLQPQFEQFEVANLFRDTLRDCLQRRPIRISMIR
jgi:hypothetical protein